MLKHNLRLHLLRAILLALAVAMFPTAANAGERVGGVDVNVLPLASMDNRAGSVYGTRHGYVEHRVQLKNTATEDRVVHLYYPDPGKDWRVAGVLSTRTVPIAAGQEVSVSLYQPNMGFGNNMIRVRVEGVKDPKVIPVTSLHSWYVNYSSPDTGQTAVLLSRAVPQEFRDRTIIQPEATPAGTVPATPPPGPGIMPPPMPVPGGMTTPTVEVMADSADRFAFLRSELPVNRWSSNWLGYSCFDAIVMTEKEAEQMPPQSQLAVRRYLECGGTLLIHGQNVPEAFVQGGDDDGKGGFLVGFGHAAASLDADKTDWEATYKTLRDMPIHVYAPEEKPSNLHDLLVAETTVPVRGLFVLVLLFGIGIGPANLWLLSRYKRRIWLWWNVPAISLLTCLLVFGYALASEGVTGRGKTASLTLLDERCHRAATIGYLSFYCPLTPSIGPRFGVDTEVTLLENQLQPWQRHHPHGSNTMRIMDWTGDQHLTSGWVNARVPTYFQIRKNEDRRERLTIEKQDDGSLKVVNALGADIRRLYLADSEGRVFEGQNISAGAERTLKLMGTPGKNQLICSSPDAGRTFLQNIFRGEWLNSFNNAINGMHSPSIMLSPGCYIAYLDRSPFMETPLEGVESEDSAAIVYGISKGQADGR